MRYLASFVVMFATTPVWAAEGASQGGGLMSFLPLVAILGIFYFLLIRPQQKQAKAHQQMVNELKRGDRVLTQGGIYGTVHAVKGKILELKISDETKVMVGKSFVTQVVQSDPTVEAEVVANGVIKG